MKEPSSPSLKRRRLVETEPSPAIALNAPARLAEQGTRWGMLLIWYMRLTAVVWLMLGLVYWTLVLQPETLGGQPFEDLGLAQQAAIVFFAVLDCVAAIGLWLAAPWGGVVWLFTALSEIALAIVLPGTGFNHSIAMFVNGALIGIYFVLNFFCGTRG